MGLNNFLYKCVFLMTLFCLSCNAYNNAKSIKENSITRIIVNRPEGVGLTSFIFELSIQDELLREKIDNKNVNFTFSAPLELLNNITIQKAYQIDSSKYHLLLNSTLWADISEEEFSKRIEHVTEKTSILLSDKQSNTQWILQTAH